MWLLVLLPAGVVGLVPPLGVVPGQQPHPDETEHGRAPDHARHHPHQRAAHRARRTSGRHSRCNLGTKIWGHLQKIFLKQTLTWGVCGLSTMLRPCTLRSHCHASSRVILQQPRPRPRPRPAQCLATHTPDSCFPHRAPRTCPLADTTGQSSGPSIIWIHKSRHLVVSRGFAKNCADFHHVISISVHH